MGIECPKCNFDNLLIPVFFNKCGTGLYPSKEISDSDSETLLEAKVFIECWRKGYNQFRPHSSLGYRPPAPEAFEASNFTLQVVH